MTSPPRWVRKILWWSLGVLMACAPDALAAPPSGQVLELPPQQAAPGEVTLELSLLLPPGWQLTPGAPQSVRLSVRDPQVLKLAPAGAAALDGPRFPLRLPLVAAPGHTVLTLDLLLNLCRTDGQGMCLLKEVRLLLPVTVAEGEDSRLLRVSCVLSVP